MIAALMLQAVSPPAGQAAPVVLDLHQSDVTETCAPNDTDDILVCGERDTGDRYRLKPLDAARFEPHHLKAETNLTGNLKGAAEAESAGIGPGVTSNRIMFRLKLPF